MQKYSRLPGTLSSVISSLDKLVELERRITRLETVPAASTISSSAKAVRGGLAGAAATAGPVVNGARTVMRFAKRRTETSAQVGAVPFLQFTCPALPCAALSAMG